MKIKVIKIGGKLIENREVLARLCDGLASLGEPFVLVHGGGPEITEMLGKIGKESQFVDGLRVTDKETAEVVQMVLAGKINKSLVNLIQLKGGKSIGLSGLDGHMIEAAKKDER